MYWTWADRSMLIDKRKTSKGIWLRCQDATPLKTIGFLDTLANLRKRPTRPSTHSSHCQTKLVFLRTARSASSRSSERLLEPSTAFSCSATSSPYSAHRPNQLVCSLCLRCVTRFRCPMVHRSIASCRRWRRCLVLPLLPLPCASASAGNLGLSACAAANVIALAAPAGGCKDRMLQLTHLGPCTRRQHRYPHTARQNQTRTKWPMKTTASSCPAPASVTNAPTEPEMQRGNGWMDPPTRLVG